MFPPMVNPYKKPSPHGGIGKEMGPQSQCRVSLQKRTFLLAGSNNNKKRKGAPGQQLTLFGDRAFDPLIDCKTCIAKSEGKERKKSTTNVAFTTGKPRE